jgi:cell division septal protein FtsQ
VRASGVDRRRLALTGAACLGCGVFGWWLATGPALTVRDVTVSGYDRPDAAQLDAALEEASSRGGSLVRPPVGAIRRAAVRFPWVRDVIVHRNWPAGLTVRIVPAEPLLVAVPARGEAVFVSPAGLVMGPAGRRGGLARVRIPGEAPAVGARLPAVARAPMTFTAALPPPLAGRLRSLRLDRGRVVGTLANGPELRLGPPVRMRAKAAALQALLAGLSPEDLEAASYIELSVPEHIAVGGLAPVTDPVPAVPSSSAASTGSGEIPTADSTSTGG